MHPPTIRLGTRASPLALAQTDAVARRLVEVGAVAAGAVEVVAVRTTGDRVGDRPLAEIGGKALFTKELDEALADGRIDAAVHSAKDVPTWLPEGIRIVACLERADVRDAFLSPAARSLDALPAGARLGTSSPRRRALVLNRRPDIAVVDMRGNVETRLRKLAEGAAEATLLAVAGLTRLGLAGRATALLAAADWPPAVGQGTIAVTARSDDARMHALFAGIDHAATSTALRCERAFLDALGGSCRTPIGGYANVADGALSFFGIIVAPDGSRAHRAARAGPAADAARLGAEAGRELAAAGGPAFFGD